MGATVFLIGIAGGSGSGKTTFAEKVRTQISKNISILHMDSYYLSNPPGHIFSEKGNANFDHPDAFDWPLLRKHLAQLKGGKSIDMPIYDFKVSARTKETEVIESNPVILFEGIFSLFDKEIRNILDVKVFLHVDSDIRFTRRLNRDVQQRNRSMDSVINQYYETVRPMHQKFLEPQKQHADFIVGEETDVAASILASNLKERISINLNIPNNMNQNNLSSAPLN